MRYSDKKNMACAALLCSALLAWHPARAAATANDSPPLAIGFAGPMGNPVLQNARNGALLAIEEHNADTMLPASGHKPGVLRQFTLIEQDDRGEPHLGQNVARYFVRSGVIGVVGHWAGDVALEVAPIYEEHGVAQLMFTAASSQLTAKGYHSIFRLLGSSDQTARYLADAAGAAIGARRIAIVANDSLQGRSLSKTFEAELARNAQAPEVVFRASVSSKVPDFAAIMPVLAASRPDLVLLSSNALQARAFVMAAARARLPASLLLTGGAINQKLMPPAGSGVTLYTLEPDAALQDCASWKTFNTRYQARFKQAPSSFARYAYNAANALMAAAEHADGQPLAEALHIHSYRGLSGDIAFDSHGNAVNSYYTLYRSGEAGWQPLQQYVLGKPAICR